MVATHYGYHCDMVDLRKRFPVGAKGTTLAQLMNYAHALNLSTRPLRADLEELSKLTLPCILHWDLNHFVVLKKVNRGLSGQTVLQILDPAVGERRVSLSEASSVFTGVALELLPNASFKAADERKKVRLIDLTGKIFGLRSAIIQIVLLSLVLEVFSIAAPLFNQFVIDDVIVSGDRDLLDVITIGFALLFITQSAISLARSWFLMRWSMDVSFQWSSRVFSHLTRLPLLYFSKRHLGDVVSRFGSLTAIQSALTTVFVESALDGLMALFALAMMFTYSAKLSTLVLVSVLLYIIIKWAFYTPFRDANRERLVLSARESSHFLETIRAMAAIKLYGREAHRLARWQNLRIATVNRDVKTQQLSILFKISNSTIFGIQSLLLFYIGAKYVMGGVLSVGMLTAFASYASTFSARISNLIDAFSNTKVLDVHYDRLGDIVFEPPESESLHFLEGAKFNGKISIRNIRFRYSDCEPWVLDGINLEIDAGESIAIVGPSGCGKTTLCKILLGLLIPNEGEIFLDGIPVNRLGLENYRKFIGTVMQEDTLVAGSLEDNISFFDANSDRQFVMECAKNAAIHDEVEAMPMGYHTLIGEMGGALSGGQKQRVLLARALYKRPLILALDEATSHLDIDNERRVINVLRDMKLTRIMIAHRPETIDSADRVIMISHGKVEEIR
jgi:ATP-binding cassette subfamily B protein RaxB